MERFEQIYAEHRDAVRAYVRRRAPVDVVDDVVADVFVVCLRRLDAVPAQPLPWLYAVARKTLANDRRRRARTAPADAVVAVDPEPVGDAALAAAFARLRERDREVLRLVAWDGVDPAQLPVALGCSAGAARVRLHRARKRFEDAVTRAQSATRSLQEVPDAR